MKLEVEPVVKKLNGEMLSKYLIQQESLVCTRRSCSVIELGSEGHKTKFLNSCFHSSQSDEVHWKAIFMLFSYIFYTTVVNDDLHEPYLLLTNSSFILILSESHRGCLKNSEAKI